MIAARKLTLGLICLLTLSALGVATTFAEASRATDDVVKIKKFHDARLQKFSDIFYDAQGKISASGQEWQHTLVCHSMRITVKEDKPYTTFKNFVREDMLGESQNKPENHCLRKAVTGIASARVAVTNLDVMTKAKGDYKDALNRLRKPLEALIGGKNLRTFICSHQGKSSRNEFGWYVASYDKINEEGLVCSADNFDPP